LGFRLSIFFLGFQRSSGFLSPSLLTYPPFGAVSRCRASFFWLSLRFVGVAAFLASPIHHTPLDRWRQGNFGVGTKNFKCRLFCGV
jgi:hypothetical protein